MRKQLKGAQYEIGIACTIGDNWRQEQIAGFVVIDIRKRVPHYFVTVKKVRQMVFRRIHDSLFGYGDIQYTALKKDN